LFGVISVSTRLVPCRQQCAVKAAEMGFKWWSYRGISARFAISIAPKNLQLSSRSEGFARPH
jgi:hypothetical protein